MRESPYFRGFSSKSSTDPTAPDAAELREAWSGLPDVEATVDGKPGMDGLELDGDRDYVILPRLYFDGRPPWTLEAIVRPVEIDQSVPEDCISRRLDLPHQRDRCRLHRSGYESAAMGD